MNRIIQFAVSIFAISLVFLGCKKPCTHMTTPNQTTEEVLAVNTAFSPKVKTVAKGTTVKWTNQDPYAHTVTSDDGTFDSGNLNQGQTFSHTFNTPGTYNYHCIYHAPAMAGTIIVTP